MSEQKGHFESGRWVEDREPEAAPETPETPKAPQVDEMVHEASTSVKKAIDDVVHLGKHLFGTKEGRDHLEKKVRAAGAELEKAIGEVAETARRNLERNG
ncbi:MAG: hypothetical protein PHP59_06125 [Methanofollis sp.]|uniref:hypothetical protein n=1 Tax=Methanofollis sp. TaxID=2052835 RepID=UPI002621D1D4|nr:hypothetical protein [Methanofollis sp.]MDD4254939.1 hypothetical protein [Methanofollis sp.]